MLPEPAAPRHADAARPAPDMESLQSQAPDAPPWEGQAPLLGSRGGSLLSGRRFAALSSLPEGLRLPPKRDVVPARHQRAALPATDLALEIPAAPLPPPQSLLPPAPVMLPSAQERQLGFNCPACFVVLIIRDPASYDGQPAPCPTCGCRILPPRRMPDSPFTLVQRRPQAPGPPWPALPG